MSRVWLRQDEGAWQVWIALNDDHDHLSSEAFIVGLGESKQEAVADAIQGLAARLVELAQQLP